MKRGKHLLGGKLFFVVIFGNLEHEEDGIDIEDVELIQFLVIAIGKKA